MKRRSTTRKRNAGAGRSFDFHGAFLKKSDAVEKEAEVRQRGEKPFIRFSPTPQGFRYLVLTARAANPPESHFQLARALKNTACTLRPMHRVAQALRAHKKRMRNPRYKQGDELVIRGVHYIVQATSDGYPKLEADLRKRGIGQQLYLTRSGGARQLFTAFTSLTGELLPRVRKLNPQAIYQVQARDARGVWRALGEHPSEDDARRALARLTTYRARKPAGMAGDARGPQYERRLRVVRLANPGLLESLGFARRPQGKHIGGGVYVGDAGPGIHPDAAFRQRMSASRPAKRTDKRAARRPAHTARQSADPELVSALRGLGYRAPQAQKMARSATGSSFDEKLRSVLRRSNSGRRANWLHPEELNKDRVAARQWYVDNELPIPHAFWNEQDIRNYKEANRRYALESRERRKAATRERHEKKKALKRAQRQGRGLLVAFPARNPKRKSRRRNPERKPASPEAQRLYQRFHGERPAGTAQVMKKEFPGPKDTAKLGDLAELFTLSDDGEYIGVFSFNTQQPAVAATPSGDQIYFLGGNQNVDAAVPRWAGRTKKDLIDLGRCYHIRYLTRKSMDRFQPIIYAHPFGREQGRQAVQGVPAPYERYDEGELPRLQYDRYLKNLLLVGGRYRAKLEGIVD